MPARHNRASQINSICSLQLATSSLPRKRKYITGQSRQRAGQGKPDRAAHLRHREKRAPSHAAKGDGFYLDVLCDGEPWRLHHIMAGGPECGTMAFVTETAPGEGTSVQVCRVICLVQETLVFQRINGSSTALRVTISHRFRESCLRAAPHSSPRNKSAPTWPRPRLWRRVATTVSRYSRTDSWLRARMVSC